MRKRIRRRDKRGLFYRNGGWWIDVQVDGKRYREYAGPTESRAKLYRDKLLAWKHDVRNGLPTVKPEGEPATLKDAAANYLNLYSKVRKRSWKRDSISIDHLNRFFAKKRLRDITADAAAEYRVSRAAEGVKPRTVNVELACLRSICRKAVDDGKIGTYPLGSRTLLQKTSAYKPRILTEAEARRLIMAAHPERLRPAIVVWLNTGLRNRELMKLRRGDVDLKERVLTVVAENAKSGKARTIPISPQVAAILEARPTGEFFFANPDSGKPIHDLIKSFQTAVTAAKIGGRCRIHDLRHSFATWAIRRGVDVKTLSEILGHADVRTTLDLYCHSSMGTKRAAVESAPDLLAESRQKVHEDAGPDHARASESVN